MLSARRASRLGLIDDWRTAMRSADRAGLLAALAAIYVSLGEGIPYLLLAPRRARHWRATY